MKKIKIQWLYLLLLLVMYQLSGCNQTEDGSFTEPITVYEKINGNYRLTSLKMVDEIAKAQGAALSEIDLSSKLDFPTFAIRLEVDDQNQPTQFSVEGTAPELFLRSGYWALNHPFPFTNGANLQVNLYTDASKTDLAGYLFLTAISGTRSTLEFKVVHRFEGRPYVSYLYKLVPATE